MPTCASTGSARRIGAETIACETRILSGVQQHDGDQRRECDKRDHEEQDEVPLIASWLDRPRRLGGQLRKVGGQCGKVV